VERAGRVGRDELDQDALGLGRTPAEVLAAFGDVPDGRPEPPLCEVEVDEAGPGDLGALHEVGLGKRLDELLRQAPGRHPGALGQGEGKVGGELAVLGAGGAGKLDRRRAGGEGAVGTHLVETGLQQAGEVIGDHV
jgi:hypothetical protein